MKKDKFYNIKEGSFKIEVNLDSREKFVLPIYMDNPSNSQMQMVVMVDETDFDEDMKILVPKTLGSDWGQACQIQLENMIKSHIEKFGRILPADLETYCIESLIVMISIADASNQTLTLAERKLIFKRLVIDFSEALNIPVELHFT